MRRELIATAGNEEISIAVEPYDSGRWRVSIGDRSYLVDAKPVRPGTWSLLIDGRSYVIDLDERKLGCTILAPAVETVIKLEDARRKRLAEAVAGHGGAGAGGEVIGAPIAGKVVKVLVAPGDQIAPGQSVAVLEAMKMENELKAERGGTVSTVHASAGQSVDTGDKLVTLA